MRTARDRFGLPHRRLEKGLNLLFAGFPNRKKAFNRNLLERFFPASVGEKCSCADRENGNKDEGKLYRAAETHGSKPPTTVDSPAHGGEELYSREPDNEIQEV
jgi:hypothetical protein